MEYLSSCYQLGFFVSDRKPNSNWINKKGKSVDQYWKRQGMSLHTLLCSHVQMTSSRAGLSLTLGFIHFCVYFILRFLGGMMAASKPWDHLIKNFKRTYLIVWTKKPWVWFLQIETEGRGSAVFQLAKPECRTSFGTMGENQIHLKLKSRGGLRVEEDKE